MYLCLLKVNMKQVGSFGQVTSGLLLQINMDQISLANLDAYSALSGRFFALYGCDAVRTLGIIYAHTAALRLVCNTVLWLQ